jgi:glycerophosphoryl diester phosphodiesterase
MDMTKIFGHRGAKGTYPENTLLSFKKAIEIGVDGLELDVHVTKDGEVVVIHDETLDRTTSGSGWIKDLTLAEIRKVSAGSRFCHFNKYEKNWDHEKVPTLQEVLELIAPYPIELNIELKTSMIPYDRIEEKVLQIVDQFASDKKVIYSSFHLPTLIRIKQMEQEANIAWLLNKGISLPEDHLSTLDLEALHLHKHIVIPDTKLYEQISHLLHHSQVDVPIEVLQYVWKKWKENHPEHLQHIYEKIRVWTVNDPNEITRLLDLNVKAIITDDPERAVRLRDKRKIVNEKRKEK